MELWQAIDLWQECLVAVALLAAVVYLLRRVGRAGRPHAPPNCAACDHCHAAKQAPREAGTGPQRADVSILTGELGVDVRVGSCGEANRRDA